MNRGNNRLIALTQAKGVQFTVGTSAAALADTPVTTELSGAGLVYLQADGTNSGTIKLGGSAGQYVSLSAGDWFPAPLPLENLSALYAIASASGQKLNALIVY